MTHEVPQGIQQNKIGKQYEARISYIGYITEHILCLSWTMRHRRGAPLSIVSLGWLGLSTLSAIVLRLHRLGRGWTILHLRSHRWLTIVRYLLLARRWRTLAVKRLLLLRWHGFTLA